MEFFFYKDSFGTFQSLFAMDNKEKKWQWKVIKGFYTCVCVFTVTCRILLSQDSTVFDHEGPLDGFNWSIVINTDRYKESPVAGAGYVSQSSTTSSRGDVNNQTLIGVDVVPITDFIDWQYFEQVVYVLNCRIICRTFYAIFDSLSYMYQTAVVFQIRVKF